MRTFIISLLIAISTIAAAQSDEAHCARIITWYGIDFSHTWFVNQKAFDNPDELSNELIPGWNSQVVDNKRKFDLKKFFNKSKFYYQKDPVFDKNIALNVETRITNSKDLPLITEDSIQGIISNYNITEPDSDVGLVLICVSLNKKTKKGSFFVTFFNTKTNEVIVTKRMEGAPRGLGMLEYWSTSFYDVLRRAPKEMGFIY